MIQWLGKGWGDLGGGPNDGIHTPASAAGASARRYQDPGKSDKLLDAV